MIHRRAPWKTKESLEMATLERVSWFNHHRLLDPIGYIPPAEAEENYYRQLARQTARAERLNPMGLLETRGNSNRWKPASFEHASLAKATLEKCESCHKAPSDSLHRQISGNCIQCHRPQQWKPATFDHDKSFRLDTDHNVTCTSCHTNNDFKRYTCYGCHEHTPAKIRSEHLEEGIRNFENCVDCHRSADDEPSKEGKPKSREKSNRD